MKASLNRERYRKHGSSEDVARDKEKEEELDGNMRSPLDLGKAVSMADERSSVGKDNGGGEVSKEIYAWSSVSSFRETSLNLCRVQRKKT